MRFGWEKIGRRASIGFSTVLIVLTAYGFADAQMPFENCPARIEVFDVNTGRYIPGAKVEAMSYLTDKVSKSRLRGGIPFFASLEEGHYAFTASAPGYQRSRHEASAWCHESYKGAMTLTIYMWKGDSTAMIYMDREDFERPPYKGKFGIKMLAPAIFDPKRDGSTIMGTVLTPEELEKLKKQDADQPKESATYSDGSKIENKGADASAALADVKPEVKTDDSEPKTDLNPEPAPQKPHPAVVSRGVLNGKAILLPKPSTPPVAKAAGASGAVNVQVTIDHEGNVIGASAVSGHQLLRAAAAEAARKAKFSPELLDGAPVKVSGVIVYNFQ